MFLGLEILWIFLEVITKLDCFRGLFLYVLWSFLSVKIKNDNIYLFFSLWWGVLLNFKYFWGIFLIIFGGKQ